MARRRHSLGPILILSAIDVLLCGFTAALTLFFVGAGAGAADQTTAELLAGRENQASGEAAGAIVANYDANSGKLAPREGMRFEAIPRNRWQALDSVAWLLEIRPTRGRPFLLSAPGDLPVAVRLGVSVEGYSAVAKISCQTGGVLLIGFSGRNFELDTRRCSLKVQVTQ